MVPESTCACGCCVLVCVYILTYRGPCVCVCLSGLHVCSPIQVYTCVHCEPTVCACLFIHVHMWARAHTGTNVHTHVMLTYKHMCAQELCDRVHVCGVCEHVGVCLCMSVGLLRIRREGPRPCLGLASPSPSRLLWTVLMTGPQRAGSFNLHQTAPSEAFTRPGVNTAIRTSDKYQMHQKI